MVTTEDVRRRQLARDAALRLFDALRTLRQHRHHAVLCRPALRRCVEAVLAATADAPLRLRLGCGQASVGGEVVFAFALHDAGFGALRTAGIGELVLPRGIAAAAVERLVPALAEATWSEDPDHDPAALLCAAAPDVHLRAATAEDADAGDRARADWWLLPGPLPAAERLQPTIERALHSNLAARCARQLLQDLDEDPSAAAAATALEPLFAELLRRGDLASAAFLLEQAQHRRETLGGSTDRLLEQARGHCDEPRLRDYLATAPRERLLDLVALVIQLGPAVTERLGRLARELHHPLADWLAELLGR